MKQKEKDVQKALGTLKKYSVYCTIEVPHTTTISVPFDMEVDAVSESAAEEEAKAFFKKMSLIERKKYVWEKAYDGEMFAEENEPDMSVLYENAEEAPPNAYSDDVLNVVCATENEE